MAFSASAIQLAQTQFFTIAIVRPDGRMVPFAAYDAGEWLAAWPEPREAFDDVAAPDAVPSIWRTRGQRVPDVWRFSPLPGGPPTDLRVTGVDLIDAHCQRQFALRTALPAVPVAPNEHARKLGIAVDVPNAAVSSVEEVVRGTAQWTTAQRLVAPVFARMEANAAGQSRQELPAETPAPTPQISSLVREIGASRPSMYFVAEKKYRTGRSQMDASCHALSIMTGWLLPQADGTYVVAGARMFVTDCDAKEARMGRPLGTIRIGNQPFWVLQEHGYEDETYLIVEVGPSEIRYPLTVNGGGC